MKLILDYFVDLIVIYHVSLVTRATLQKAIAGVLERVFDRSGLPETVGLPEALGDRTRNPMIEVVSILKSHFFYPKKIIQNSEVLQFETTINYLIMIIYLLKVLLVCWSKASGRWIQGEGLYRGGEAQTPSGHGLIESKKRCFVWNKHWKNRINHWKNQQKHWKNP